MRAGDYMAALGPCAGPDVSAVPHRHTEVINNGEKGSTPSPSSSVDDAAPDEQFHLVDAVAERRLLRKIDLTVYPILFIVYMMSFLDRINISNAKIQGMAKDLDLLVGNRFNIALFVSGGLFKPQSSLSHMV